MHGLTLLVSQVGGKSVAEALLSWLLPLALVVFGPPFLLFQQVFSQVEKEC
jgi:hypothetical protein